MKIQHFKTIIVLSFISTYAFSQKPVVNEEINITKDREVVLPKANRIIDKIPPVVTDKKEKKMSYAFFDRKPTAVEETKFVPNVVSPVSKKKHQRGCDWLQELFQGGSG